MKTVILTRENWYDLVFENRNKDYGAYLIRKSYSRHVAEAFIASLLFVNLVLAIPRLNSFLASDHPTLSAGRIETGTTIILPPPIKLIEKVQRREITRIKSGDKTIIPVVTQKAVPDEEVLDPNAQVRAAEDESHEGEGFVVNSELTGTGTGDLVEVPPTIFDRAEVMPQYVGGTEKMIKFIEKHMRYPGHARMIGIEGRVFVKFVVSDDGTVNGVEVIRGISADCDKEAARVIAMMPPWRPGRQNNTPVSVRIVLPINFKLDH